MFAAASRVVVALLAAASGTTVVRAVDGDGGARWYPDYTRTYLEGICLSGPPLKDIVSYKTEKDCCDGAYAGQASGVCLGDDGSDVWYPDYSLPWEEGVCAKADRGDVPNGVVFYSSQLNCCKYSYRGQASDACSKMWVPSYERGYQKGVCTIAFPVPEDLEPYRTRSDCCKGAFASQTSGACVVDNPGSAEATLSLGWFPDDSDKTCVNDTDVPMTEIQYITQSECCQSEFGYGVDPDGSRCSAESPYPMSASLNPAGLARMWRPNYLKGWNAGTCTNSPPVLDSGVDMFALDTVADAYVTKDECCNTAFSGQQSGACLGLISDPEPRISVPSLIAEPAAASECYKPLRDDGICSLKIRNRNPCRPNEYPTNVECCREGIVNRFENPDVIACLDTFPCRFVEDTIRIQASLTRTALPPTDQQKIDLAEQLENVFYLVANTIMRRRQIVVKANIDPTSGITRLNRRGIIVVANLEARTYRNRCSTGSREMFRNLEFNFVNNFARKFGNELRREGFNNRDVTAESLEPTSSPTEAPSSPPTELSRRTLAKQIDLLFGPKNQMYLGNDRNQLRTMLQETFSNAGDVEDIVLNTYDDSKLSSNSFDDQSSLSAIDSDARHHAIDMELDDSLEGRAGEANQCKCVDCNEDKNCGGLWKGRKFADHGSHPDRTALNTQLKIHVVVSHCMNGLGWMNDYIKGFDVASIHVISKCGQEVIEAPQLATIEVQSNTGSWDHMHTYAYYISTVLPQRVEADEENSVVVFLKDDISADVFDQSWRMNDFGGLVWEAASGSGFGCGISSGLVNFGPHSFDLSAYHETMTLHSFSVDAPSNNLATGLGSNSEDDDPILLSSEFKSLGLWWDAMGIPPPPEVVRVCYGGTFAGSVRNIFKTSPLVWKNIERSLSQGNTSQERHYAERSWALLIASPLEPYQSEALLERADGVHMDQNLYHGALLRRPKLYIHIGAEGTLSTEVLTESLVQNIETLELDGYKVAVHGKFEAGRYRFPDIDRLGACMWDEMGKSLFPGHMSEAKVCPEQLLPTLSNYMNSVFKESKDMIMLNPWLVRPGTAGSLSIYLDPVWDASIVIYYRRFFDWLRVKFYDWRRDLFENSLSPDKNKIPKSSFRYIDFIREYCKQLFYGKDAFEDGFPLRPLLRYLGGAEKRLSESMSESDFDPTTNFDYEELTGLDEYVYFVAKQYRAQSRFRNGIEIVNSHDNHGIETNFYCHVLHDAPNACRYAVQQEHQLHEAIDDEIPLQANATFSLDPSTALEDIVVHGYIEGHLSFDPLAPKKKFRQQILLWVEMLSVALKKNAVPIEQLPTECLYNYERRRLLEASLAYERSMLPDFFASPRGGLDLKREFEVSKFCSVDTDALLSNSNWGFLFEDAAAFTVPTQQRAFVHIGAARTNGASIERMLTKASDQRALKEDLYMVFSGHGHLAPCLWSDGESQFIAENAGVDLVACPTDFLSLFNEFLSNAMATGNDVIIYDEWLSMPSSETGLADVLGNHFDPVIVLHYRHFFDWMLASYHEWRLDVEFATVQSMGGRIRLVDFIRLFCNQLFASGISQSAHPRLLELLDLPDYTYNLWKQYTKIPAFSDHNVKIVNYHDGHVVKSFYCDVLNSEKACKLESDRLVPYGPAKSPTEPLISKYEDMAMGLNWSTGVGSKERFYTLGQNYKDKMDQRGLVEDDLPKECLSEAEKSMLLMVSLEYERVLLPDFHSSGGGEEMREQFGTLVAKGTFCSVDLEKLIDSLEWQFLFES